jgi:hypothetical protein
MVSRALDQFSMSSVYKATNPWAHVYQFISTTPCFRPGPFRFTSKSTQWSLLTPDLSISITTRNISDKWYTHPIPLINFFPPSSPSPFVYLNLSRIPSGEQLLVTPTIWISQRREGWFTAESSFGVRMKGSTVQFRFLDWEVIESEYGTVRMSQRRGYLFSIVETQWQ